MFLPPITSLQESARATGTCLGRQNSSHCRTTAWEGNTPPSRSWMPGCTPPLPRHNLPPFLSSGPPSRRAALPEPPSLHSHGVYAGTEPEEDQDITQRFDVRILSCLANHFWQVWEEAFFNRSNQYNIFWNNLFNLQMLSSKVTSSGYTV